MRVREKSTEDDLSHLVTARRKLIEDQMLAGHGRLVAIRRLLDVVEGRTVAEWIAATGVSHLNVSRAHVQDETSAALMRLGEAALPRVDLRDALARVSASAPSSASSRTRSRAAVRSTKMPSTKPVSVTVRS